MLDFIRVFFGLIPKFEGKYEVNVKCILSLYIQYNIIY